MVTFRAEIAEHSDATTIRCVLCSREWAEHRVSAELRYSRTMIGRLCPRCLADGPATMAVRLTTLAENYERSVQQIRRLMVLPKIEVVENDLIERAHRVREATAELVDRLNESLAKSAQLLAESRAAAASLRTAIELHRSLAKQRNQIAREFFAQLPVIEVPPKISSALHDASANAAALRVAVLHFPKARKWQIDVRALMSAEMNLARNHVEGDVADVRQQVERRYWNFLA